MLQPAQTRLRRHLLGARAAAVAVAATVSAATVTAAEAEAEAMSVAAIGAAADAAVETVAALAPEAWPVRLDGCMQQRRYPLIRSAPVEILVVPAAPSQTRSEHWCIFWMSEPKASPVVPYAQARAAVPDASHIDADAYQHLGTIAEVLQACRR
mmetsp:Transcript_54155/g.89885  ORF Transcript_54155/g.89885 Transcript_54155/m.89885 type:complete len:154 (+) Transcript_54155:351-812(+)